MFDIGWSEMLVVGAVALLVIGPKDLPAALRQVGKWMGTVRRMAADFQGQVNQAMKEAELDELRREVDSLRTGFSAASDPVRTAGAEMKALVEKPVAALPPPEPELEAKVSTARKPRAAAATAKPKAPSASGKSAPKKKPAAKKPEKKT